MATNPSLCHWNMVHDILARVTVPARPLDVHMSTGLRFGFVMSVHWGGLWARSTSSLPQA
jgi:hypothetical protein